MPDPENTQTFTLRTWAEGVVTTNEATPAAENEEQS